MTFHIQNESGEMILCDKNVYPFWDQQITMTWMFEEVFAPVLHNLQRQNEDHLLVQVYHQTFCRICLENPVQLRNLISRDGQWINEAELNRYCRTFDDVFESAFRSQYPTVTPPNLEQRQLVLEWSLTTWGRLGRGG